MVVTRKKGEAPVGETVLFDGQTYLLVDILKRYSRELDDLVQLVVFENINRRVTAVMNDLRWDDDLNCWYLWGRALAKADRAVVAELRDRGLLPARRTRTPGNPPAGGEHLNLYKTLFLGKPAGFWNSVLVTVRQGQDLPSDAVTAIATYTEVFKQPLIDGYAIVDANDSEGV